MSDLNSDPCMNMISYMRTCYFSSQDSCLIHCTGWNTFREWSSLQSISFTTQYVVSSLVYCISSQSCNENNCFMGFFPSASIYLRSNNQYESLQLSKKMVLPFYVSKWRTKIFNTSTYSSVLQLLVSKVPTSIRVTRGGICWHFKYLYPFSYSFNKPLRDLWRK